jgi:hypothetical protein
MYLMIVGTLCLALLGGVLGWFTLALYEVNMPDGLAAILATIAGGLVGVLLPGGGQSRRPGDAGEDGRTGEAAGGS